MASGGRRRKPRRGSRPKAKKKTKYLSLSSLIIKAELETPSPPRSPEDAGPEAEVKKEEDGGGGHHQVAEPPFALHHEASTLFASSPAPSLSDILGAADESPSPSASPDGGVSGGKAGFPGAEDDEDLARRALRGRERWVYCCSSGSSPPPTTTTATTSSSSPCSSSAASTGASARSLLLKLDYEEILAAWADRGPLYIGHNAAPKQELDNVLVEVVEPPQHPPAAAAATATTCLWSAPQSVRDGRAESVRRYKEKRRNRLFAHRVRYEVRRANAVKRPRFKGRFIKEHEEPEIQAT